MAEPEASPPGRAPTQDRYRALYGARTGHWMLLEATCGLISPPDITAGVSGGGLVTMRYLGDPNDVIRTLYNGLLEDGVPAAQAGLAGLLGVSQQTVSRYISGAMAPQLCDDGWAGLVRVAS